jgi:uncharacterized membrane protein YcaP (DUF421 family)
VKEACIESDGQISVIESKEKHQQKREIVKKAPVELQSLYNIPSYKEIVVIA